MAKKKKIEDKTRYIPELLEDIMGSGFGRYAKYIIQERALPDARDGLKPVQRRILYAMYHDGNTWDHAYRKSAKTVGLVIGNYHPHGDTSVYDAMVRMSQDWKVRLPLIDMHGNNGSIDDDPAAAMRYTEVRLAKVTQVMEDDLDKDTVEMTPNFDDTENEPTVLPVPFPVMLVNGDHVMNDLNGDGTLLYGHTLSVSLDPSATYAGSGTSFLVMCHSPNWSGVQGTFVSDVIGRSSGDPSLVVSVCAAFDGGEEGMWAASLLESEMLAYVSTGVTTAASSTQVAQASDPFAYLRALHVRLGDYDAQIRAMADTFNNEFLADGTQTALRQIEANTALRATLRTEYRSLLADGAQITFKTDHEPLFAFALTQFELAGYILDYAGDDYRADFPDTPKSEYEERLVAQGAQVHALIAHAGPLVGTPVQTASLSLVDYLPDDLHGLSYVPHGMQGTVVNLRNRRDHEAMRLS